MVRVAVLELGICEAVKVVVVSKVPGLRSQQKPFLRLLRPDGLENEAGIAEHRW